MESQKRVSLFVESCVKNLVSLNLTGEEMKLATHRLGLELSRYAAYKHVLDTSAEALLNEWCDYENH